jgi:hypothetical protein
MEMAGEKYVGRWEAWSERLERIEEEVLGEWRPLGSGKFGWWGDKCNECESLDCEACGPEYLLVVRSVYKKGERLALYSKDRKLADGDEEVKRFLHERGIPFPLFLEG